VKAISLDDSCEKLARRPDVLKRDVEGTEYEVLIGASQLYSWAALVKLMLGWTVLGRYENTLNENFESGFGTLVVEMGIGGLILWLVMSFAILISAWRVVRKLKGSPWFPLAFMFFLYAGILLIPMTFTGMQGYEDFVVNAFFWLLLGILFRLPTLAVSAQFAVSAQMAPVYDPRIRMR
jgi:hypothetical protein